MSPITTGATRTKRVFMMLMGGPVWRAQVRHALTEASGGSLLFDVSERADGDEGHTLHMLWSFCRVPEHRNDAVWYIHSKGSFHPSPANNILRDGLTAHVLSRECNQMVFEHGYDACGARFASHPHRHFPGNMWLANCSFVSLLPDPSGDEYEASRRIGNNCWRGRSIWQNRTMPDRLCGMPDWCFGAARYRFEHWIGILVDGAMADCAGEPGGLRPATRSEELTQLWYTAYPAGPGSDLTTSFGLVRLRAAAAPG